MAKPTIASYSSIRMRFGTQEQSAARLIAPHPQPRVVFHAATRMHVPTERRAAFDGAIDAIGEHGPLYHVWQEPASAPHYGAASDEQGALALHRPDDDKPVPLIGADGHLEWMAPLDVSL